MSNYQDRFSEKQLLDQNTSFSKILINISPKSKMVLDIGCSGGYFDKFIKDKTKATIWGVEIDKSDAKIASKIVDKIITDNLEQKSWESVFGNVKFDSIVCADVIEHLFNPWQFTSKLKGILNNNGNVYFSIPNVTHYSIKLNLLQNKWPYDDFGLMDKTHLHFFGYSDVVKLIEDGGLFIKKFEFTTSDIPNAELLSMIHQSKLDITQKLVDNLFSFESHIFQFIIVATNKKPKKYKSYNNVSVKREILKQPLRYKPDVNEILSADNNSSFSKLNELTRYNDLLKNDLEIIYSSKTYRLWQYLNKIKKKFK